jgi:hypothetical protein
VDESFGHRVIERGSPACGNIRNGFFELVCVIRESLPVEKFDRNVVIEIHDEHLILRIAGLCEGGHCRRYFRKVGAHAAAVIDDQAHGHGSIPSRNAVTLCNRPSSYTRKFCKLNPEMKCPFASVTLTGSTTNSVFAKIVDWPVVLGGADCCGRCRE